MIKRIRWVLLDRPFRVYNNYIKARTELEYMERLWNKQFLATIDKRRAKHLRRQCEKWRQINNSLCWKVDKL